MYSNLKSARCDAGLSVAQVAHVAGLHPGTVRRLEASPELTPAAIRIAAAIAAAGYVRPSNGNGNGHSAVSDLDVFALLARVDQLERQVRALEIVAACW